MTDEPLWALPEKLVPYATAIRKVCIDWSYLEATINRFLKTLTGIADLKKFQAVAHNVDLREKLKIIVGLSFVARPSDVWFAHVQWCINQLDNDLRNRRNRFVHDQWILELEGGIKRVQLAAVMKKRQARKALEYYTEIVGREDVQEILKLSDDIHEMGLRLSMLMFGLEGDNAWQATLQELAPLPDDGKIEEYLRDLQTVQKPPPQRPPFPG